MADNPKIAQAGIKNRRQLVMIVSAMLTERWQSYSTTLKAVVDQKKYTDQVKIPPELGDQLDKIAYSKLSAALGIYDKSSLVRAALRDLLAENDQEYKALDKLFHITIDEVCVFAKKHRDIRDAED